MKKPYLKNMNDIKKETSFEWSDGSPGYENCSLLSCKFLIECIILTYFI